MCTFKALRFALEFGRDSKFNQPIRRLDNYQDTHLGLTPPVTVLLQASYRRAYNCLGMGGVCANINITGTVAVALSADSALQRPGGTAGNLNF